MGIPTVAWHALISEVVFLGKDNQFDEQWLSLQQLASKQAAFGVVTLHLLSGSALILYR